VLVLCCPIEAKETMIEADPDKFFNDARYNGYPAILLRLEAVNAAELRVTLISAWRFTAPPKLLAQLPDQAGVS
jgi:hypothetical protein